MKQAARFLVKPGQFFNQLQWSRHHGYILFAFLLIAAIEAQVGREHTLYQVYANYLSQAVGIGFDLALWIIVAGKIAMLAIGSFILGNVIWFVGNHFGTKNSRRVLVRRLSIVFTVAMGAYTASHLEALYPWMGTLSFFLAFWSLLLGYFAIREQFALTHIETALVGFLTILLVVFSWNWSNDFFETAAKKALKEIAFQPKQTTTHSIKPKY